MTKPEVTGLRSLEFSKWLKKNLPDSDTGQMVGDIDFVLWNYTTKQLVIVEEKCKKRMVDQWYKNMMREIFVPALEEFCGKNKIKFGGFIVVQFENLSPLDGKLWINGKRATPTELLDRLNLKNS